MEQFVTRVYFFSSLFLLIAGVLTILMLVHRRIANKRIETENNLRERYRSFLSGFLLLPVDNSFMGIKLSNVAESGLEPMDLQSKRRRVILAEELYALQKCVGGQQKAQLSNYFLGLGLQKEVEDWLCSKNVNKKVMALNMIKVFGLRGYVSQLKDLINLDEVDISTAAITAIICLENSVEILCHITKPLSDWDLHAFHAVIKGDRLLTSEFHQLCMEDRLQPGLKGMRTFLAEPKSDLFTLPTYKLV